MHHFFVEPSQITDSNVIILGEDVNHIKNVLRMKPGEEIGISSGTDSKEYRCRIDRLEDEAVSCTVCSVSEGGNELPSRVYLFQGLPKADKLELIIQKTVELGVHRIIPVSCRRCVVKLDDKKTESKLKRWQAISEAAAKQSRRGIIPEIAEPMSFKEAVDHAAQMDVRLIAYELSEGMDRTRELLSKLKGGEDIAVFIGPEGGFEEAETEYAASKGFEVITLGRRILRTETAGLTVMAWLSYLLDD